MAKWKYNQIIVVDLEATCWVTGNWNPPEGQQSDIIEMGISRLPLKTYNPQDRESVYIKPSRSGISAYCTDLTGITDETLKGAKDFESAFGYINNRYKPKYKVWAGWGAFDETRIRRECEEKKVVCPFSTEYINIKALFSMRMGFTRAVGLGKALEKLGWEFDGKQHCGADDAFNAAKILGHILRPNLDEH